MKQRYQDRSFRGDSITLISVMNSIINEYINQGFRLTVRQLYYQLVARDIIPNTERSYKRITSLVNDARLAGVMDWDAIEDRTRDFIRKPRWSSPSDILTVCATQYHEDMWDSQPTRVFVIVEKEALAGVLERTCSKYDVPLLAARGYPSGTVLREFAQNDLIPAINSGQSCLILHLGDHDPSGIDMTRDLFERVSMFAESNGDRWQLDLKRIALNMPQIEEIKPPENPAKSTDARFADYKRRYGSSSWELDALSPRYLASLLEREMEAVIDQQAWEEAKASIEHGKSRINDAAAWLDQKEH